MSGNLEGRIPPHTHWKTIITLILVIIALLALTGCATLAPLLDVATDPRLLEVIDTLRHLIDQYRKALTDPALFPAASVSTHENLRDLERQIEAQFQKLETIGYAKRAKVWRADLGMPPSGPR